MARINEYILELAYPDKSIDPSAKVIWCNMDIGKFKDCKFNFPISMMIPYDNGSSYMMGTMMKHKRMIKSVRFKMTAGFYLTCTTKSKKSPSFGGGYRFPSTKKYLTEQRVVELINSHGTGVRTTNVTGSVNYPIPAGDRRRVQGKQWYCKTCQGRKEIERDSQNKAYCVDCGHEFVFTSK